MGCGGSTPIDTPAAVVQTRDLPQEIVVSDSKVAEAPVEEAKEIVEEAKAEVDAPKAPDTPELSEKAVLPEDVSEPLELSAAPKETAVEDLEAPGMVLSRGLPEAAPAVLSRGVPEPEVVLRDFDFAALLKAAVTPAAPVNPVPGCIADSGARLLAAFLHNKGFPNSGGFLSPLSAYYALALALNGAGTKSATFTQGLNLLAQPSTILQTEEKLNENLSKLSQELKPVSGDPTQLLLANSVWSGKADLLPGYIGKVQDLFDARADKAESADEINDWAEQATKGLIKEAIPPGSTFDAVLVNAVYFKGLWEHKFNSTSTVPLPFTSGLGATKDVPTMVQIFKTADPGRGVTISEQAGLFTAVRMPYKGEAYSAVAILPDASKTPLDVCPHLSGLLDSSNWSSYPEVTVHLPKFKMTSKVMLKNAIMAMGWQDAFLPKADFSRIAATPVAISDIHQTVVVIVDEEGSEAAATTSVMMTRAFVMPKVVAFDRPFLFMIVHDATATPLFLGTVSDPSLLS